MSDQEQYPHPLPEQADRQEQFRYTDLSHPLMQLLYRLELDDNGQHGEAYP